MIDALHKTTNELGIHDQNKKANYIKFKLDLLGHQVQKFAEDRVALANAKDLELTRYELNVRQDRADKAAAVARERSLEKKK